MHLNINLNLKWIGTIFVIALGLAMGPLFVLFCRAVSFVGGVAWSGDGAVLAVGIGVVVGVVSAFVGGALWYDANER